MNRFALLGLVGVLLPGALMGATAFGAELPPELPVQVVEGYPPIKTVAAIPYLHADRDDALVAVRTEALGPDGSPAQAEALLERYAANQPIIDGMLSTGPSDAQRDAIRRDLGVVPTAVLQRVASAGTRIWAVPDGQTEVPSELLVADGRTDQQIRSMWRDFEQGYGVSPTLSQVQATAATAVPGEKSSDMLAGYPWAGQRVDDLARYQGASTPEEIASFTSLFKTMNPGLKVDQPLAAGTSVYLPDLFIYKGQRYSGTRWNDISYVNYELQHHKIDGLYVSRQNLIVVLDETLPDPSPVQGHRRIVLHEFGHAVDYMAEIDATRGKAHQEELAAVHKATLERQADGDMLAFITDYAKTNPAEHYADAFEAYFTGLRADGADQRVAPRLNGDYETLTAHEPAMAALIARDVAHFEKSDLDVGVSSLPTPNGRTHVDPR